MTSTAAPAASVDIDELPPTQYLILEVLAARHRTGEPYWTFPDRLKRSVKPLEDAGLVWTRSGPAEGAFQVWFTESGKAASLMDGYVSPLAAPVERVRALCRAAQSGGRDLLRLAPSQVLAALEG